MSGFERMHSSVNQLLHPTVDPADRYDPTFLGVSHKRKYATPTHLMGSGTTQPQPQQQQYGSYGSYFSSTLNSTMPNGGARATPIPSMAEGSTTHYTSDQWLNHRGKRPDPYGPRHNPSVLSQDEAMLDGYAPSGSIATTRFGKGFNRRAHSAIDAERPRMELEAARATVGAVKQQVIRQRHADRDRPLNPLSWQPTAASTYFHTEESRAANYEKFSRTTAQTEGHFNTTSGVGAHQNTSIAVTVHASTSAATPPHQPAEQRPTSKLLQPPLYPANAADRAQSKRVYLETYRTSVDPPSIVDSLPERPQTVLSSRITRFRNEGLAKPKEWGVAQQMKCGDGYVLPEIATTGDFKAAKRQVRPQSVQDTRPW